MIIKSMSRKVSSYCQIIGYIDSENASVAGNRKAPRSEERSLREADTALMLTSEYSAPPDHVCSDLPPVRSSFITSFLLV
ncbi:hypothetical protein EV658_13410 [Phaeovulum veldkampii DSM 11550]|nr:hypothetical protein EV658_13410 [Phaeovulum veldkampii DSM 11550]